MGASSRGLAGVQITEAPKPPKGPYRPRKGGIAEPAWRIGEETIQKQEARKIAQASFLTSLAPP